jgi:hypothetical protein
MKKLLVAVIVVALGWKGFDAYQRASLAAQPADTDPTEWSSEDDASFSDEDRFSCDGRTYCSQMTSCAEATYFINHCPGTKMDGNNDGVPCESQWCGR